MPSTVTFGTQSTASGSFGLQTTVQSTGIFGKTGIQSASSSSSGIFGQTGTQSTKSGTFGISTTSTGLFGQTGAPTTASNSTGLFGEPGSFDIIYFIINIIYTVHSLKMKCNNFKILFYTNIDSLKPFNLQLQM
jgi:energy-converting hydrogenase Eha subunit H